MTDLQPSQRIFLKQGNTFTEGSFVEAVTCLPGVIKIRLGKLRAEKSRKVGVFKRSDVMTEAEYEAFKRKGGKQ